jgi:hypothetical protein
VRPSFDASKSAVLVDCVSNSMRNSQSSRPLTLEDLRVDKESEGGGRLVRLQNQWKRTETLDTKWECPQIAESWLPLRREPRGLVAVRSSSAGRQW